MNAEINDGGPAFPMADFDHQTFTPQTIDEHRRLLSGMSLRDYFAAEALGSMVLAVSTNQKFTDVCCNEALRCGVNFEDYVAARALDWADALLKARGAA